MPSFGAQLRALRNRAGISRDELARRAGLCSDSIRDYERGSVTPLAPNLIRLADALGVPVEMFCEVEYPVEARA
jgi:transcriptional regulator with XRE-family HTH domain